MPVADGNGGTSIRGQRPRKEHGGQSSLHGKVAVVTGGGRPSTWPKGAVPEDMMARFFEVYSGPTPVEQPA
jgi:hypothetical protein